MAQMETAIVEKEEPAFLLTRPRSVQGRFFDQYSIKEEIGQGAFSTVSICIEKSSGKTYACKAVNLRPLRLNGV